MLAGAKAEAGARADGTIWAGVAEMDMEDFDVPHLFFLSRNCPLEDGIEGPSLSAHVEGGKRTVQRHTFQSRLPYDSLRLWR
jgi:hypothetical protein